MTLAIISDDDNDAVDSGLDYILSHFEHQPKLWPRTITTKTTECKQIIAYSREQAIARFRQANFMDCRISAYQYWRPCNTSEFAGVKNAVAPNFIMIDLDLCNFDLDDNALLHALRQTLRKTKELLQLSRPTVIWSGNGYHIYIPIDAPILENTVEFSDTEQVSSKFIRFAEWYLSNGKCDPAHNATMSLNNCLLRVPGSINSKNNAQVKIVRELDKKAPLPNINLLIGSFYVYLKDQEIKESRYRNTIQQPSWNNNGKSIYWIEKLLQTPLPDYRKSCIWRLLAPYLINVKGLSYDQSFSILAKWLDNCSKLGGLHFNSKLKIKQDLHNAIKTKYYPIGLAKLNSTDKELYNLLQNHGVING
jgi:Primase X